MALLPLDKKFHPDFAIPNKRPVGRVALDYKDIEHAASLNSWFMVDQSNKALGNGATVALNGDAALTPKGLVLDGTGDYAQVDNAFALEINSVLTGDFTVHIRVKNTNPAQTNSYLINNGSNQFAIIYGFVTRTYETFITASNFRKTIKQIGTADTSTHLISVVREGSTYRIYFDGEEVINETGPSGALNGDMKFGASNGGGDNFEGTISDVVFMDAPQSKAFCTSISRDFYKQLKPVNQIGYFTSSIAAVTSALTGTATATITETDITDGGKTIIVTLTGDTFKAAGTGPIGSTADTQALIDGFDAAASPTNGWNNEVRDKALTSEVVRTSSTIATWTISAQAGYDISAQETITGTIPTDVLVTGAGAITSTPTFTIDPVVSGRIMGSLAGAGGLAGVGGLAGRRGGMAG